jgi:dihydrolipoamide dehydrogenase
MKKAYVQALTSALACCLPAERRLSLSSGSVGVEASTLISELALAIEMGATAEDLALTIHPHPTLGEVIMEAAENAVRKMDTTK